MSRLNVVQSSSVMLEDVLIAARTVYGEARGESFDSKVAVANVLINRWVFKVGDRDHGLAAAALRWRQFSAWNEGDPNRERMLEVDFRDPLFRECVAAVLYALDRRDTTNGSRHYHTKAISPNWAEGKTPVIEFGEHVFYNDVD